MTANERVLACETGLAIAGKKVLRFTTAVETAKKAAADGGTFVQVAATAEIKRVQIKLEGAIHEKALCGTALAEAEKALAQLEAEAALAKLEGVVDSVINVTGWKATIARHEKNIPIVNKERAVLQAKLEEVKTRVREPPKAVEFGEYVDPPFVPGRNRKPNMAWLPFQPSVKVAEAFDKPERAALRAASERIDHRIKQNNEDCREAEEKMRLYKTETEKRVAGKSAKAAADIREARAKGLEAIKTEVARLNARLAQLKVERADCKFAHNEEACESKFYIHIMQVPGYGGPIHPYHDPSISDPLSTFPMPLFEGNTAGVTKHGTFNATRATKPTGASERTVDVDYTIQKHNKGQPINSGDIEWLNNPAAKEALIAAGRKYGPNLSKLTHYVPSVPWNYLTSDLLASRPARISELGTAGISKLVTQIVSKPVSRSAQPLFGLREDNKEKSAENLRKLFNTGELRPDLTGHLGWLYQYYDDLENFGKVSVKDRTRVSRGRTVVRDEPTWGTVSPDGSVELCDTSPANPKPSEQARRCVKTTEERTFGTVPGYPRIPKVAEARSTYKIEPTDANGVSQTCFEHFAAYMKLKGLSSYNDAIGSLADWYANLIRRLANSWDAIAKGGYVMLLEEPWAMQDGYTLSELRSCHEKVLKDLLPEMGYTWIGFIDMGKDAPSSPDNYHITIIERCGFKGRVSKAREADFGTNKLQAYYCGTGGPYYRPGKAPTQVSAEEKATTTARFAALANAHSSQRNQCSIADTASAHSSRTPPKSIIHQDPMVMGGN